MLFAALFLVVLDQAVKWFLLTFYPQIVVKNSGIIFGWVQNPFLFWFLILLGFGALIWLIVKSQNEYQKFFPLLIILSGAISNFADRVRLGFVIDYFRLGNFSTFNLADIFIYAGIIIYGYQIFRYKQQSSDSSAKM